MVDKFDTPFDPLAPAAVASYDFLELATGVGYAKFYCFDTEDASGADYNIISEVIETKNQSTNSNNLEFSTTFNQLTTIEGDMFIRMHWGFRDNGNGSTLNATVSIQKNGVEVGTVTSEDLTSTANVSAKEVMKVNIPRTSFATGDVLTAEVTISTSGSIILYFIAHDPEDGGFTPGGGWTGGALTESQFKLTIPFKIAL